MQYLQPKAPNYLRLLKRYTQRKEDEGLSSQRVGHLTYIASQLLAFLEAQEVYTIEDITLEHLEAYMAYLRQKPHPYKAGGLSASYINGYRSGVNSILEYALNVQTSPFYLPMMKGTPLDPKKVPTVNDIKRLFKACGDTLLGQRDRAVLALLYGCGLRRGEAHTLDIDDVDFGRGAVWVRKSKTGAQRLVPMSPGTRKHLERYRFRTRPLLAAYDRTESAFLVSKYGGRLSKMGITYIVKALAKKAGFPPSEGFSPHALRHAIATHLVERLPLEDIARFLGHVSLDTTQKYTHIHQLQMAELNKTESLRRQTMNSKNEQGNDRYL